uniref:Uncharacterized protein n=1 Tax=Timema shepardi TaxID=629360 RepID=A0A7R9G2P3_TIMSH|nr:unnamed protein product [Timema shepardi]
MTQNKIEHLKILNVAKKISYLYKLTKEKMTEVRQQSNGGTMASCENIRIKGQGPSHEIFSLSHSRPRAKSFYLISYYAITCDLHPLAFNHNYPTISLQHKIIPKNIFVFTNWLAN